MYYEYLIGLICVIAGYLGAKMLQSAEPQQDNASDNQDETPLATRVRQLDQELTDLSDRVNQWMRRTTMREVRAAKEKPEPEVTPVNHMPTKDELRRRVYRGPQ